MKQKSSLKNTYILGGNRFTLPKCMLCDNFIDDDSEQNMRCKAFPNGIPDHVLWESFDKECNKGIMFKEE